jgi:uncharacterized integral membrane protein
MPYKYFDDQFEDEEMLFIFRKHPVVMRKGLIISSLALLVGPLFVLAQTYIYANNPEKIPTVDFFFMSLGASAVLSILVFMPSWISWYFSVFIVTNQRLIQITQKGLFKRSVVDIGIDKIQTISYQINGLQETLLGFGTIVIQTFVGELIIHEVHHPKVIQKRLAEILRGLNINSSPTITDND